MQKTQNKRVEHRSATTERMPYQRRRKRSRATERSHSSLRGRTGRGSRVELRVPSSPSITDGWTSKEGETEGQAQVVQLQSSPTTFLEGPPRRQSIEMEEIEAARPATEMEIRVDEDQVFYRIDADAEKRDDCFLEAVFACTRDFPSSIDAGSSPQVDSLSEATSPQPSPPTTTSLSGSYISSPSSSTSAT